LNYEFDFGDNSQKVSGGNSKVSHSFAAAGSYNVSLVVKDDLGATDSDGCAIVIGDLNKPDVTLIKPIDNKQVTQGESVQVLADATASPGRTIAKVELLADGVLYGSADTTAPYEFTYIVPSDAPTGSTITLQAKATDNLNSAGLSVPKNLKVKNDPPVASFTAVVSGALKVALDATSSSDTETPKGELQIRWDFDNDNVWDTGWSTTKVIEHTYPAEGSYTIKLGVKDGIGQTSNATKDVTLSLVQYVSGNITTTTWTGTIVITGDTVVPSGNTLTISDGTSVLFTSIDANSDGVGDYDLTINGTLKIAGTAGNPVIFTVYGASNKNPRAWNRIILNGTGSEIKNAIIEYGDIGLEIKDNASISDTTVRFNQYCLNVLTGASATLNKVTLTDSVKDCVSVSAGTINITESAIKDNGGNGIYVNGGTMNLSLSSVTGNDKSGIEYYKGGAGLVTKNKVMGNAFEGVRIGTDGTNDPNPVINYNNVYGNALQKGRVVEDVNISASTTASDYLTKTSSSWQTPSGEILDYIY
ncbi:MAG: PKD domain-containing protein, partial [Deltaproteobacteria bacterium]|nr:PKD domain-containing protein [Deltaproteobacteria bacterium]